ncbi:DUF3370 family protein [Geitlerinema splendidum]|nr:DUF3370 family protein [Geitlerinema splendidum]
MIGFGKRLSLALFFAATGWQIFPATALAFSDTQNYWGQQCIAELAKRQLVSGYPDGRFRPNGSVTRAEFAVLMLNAFPNAPIKRPQTRFSDVPPSHWAYRAITDATMRDFFAGYPGGIFQPQQAIPKAQTLGVLAGAMGYARPNYPLRVLQRYFRDANGTPNYAQSAIAAAAQQGMIAAYPDPQQLNPNQITTRGEAAVYLCRALNIPGVPPQYIAGVEIRPQTVLPLPGSLDAVPIFNSNSPELVLNEGILLSTFPPTGKQHAQAHLNYRFNGRFDVFTHHITRAETPTQAHPLYQGILIHNPTSQPITVEVLQAASYLGTPDAPFIDLPDVADNTDGRVYSGPGSRVTSDILRGVRQETFPESITIDPQQSQMLMNKPIPIQRTPSSNGRSTAIRLQSSGPVYLANIALKAPREGSRYRAPNLSEWENALNLQPLATPRDRAPTPLDPPQQPTIFSRVAGVSQGSRWQAEIKDSEAVDYLSIPATGNAISYVLSTLHLVTLGTNQIQSAPMLRRYPDTAYYAHSNYSVEYDLTLPLINNSDRIQDVTLSLSSPLKDEGGTDRLLFHNPRVDQVHFRGTVKLRYQSDKREEQTRYVHIVQRRGQPGEPLVKLRLFPQERRTVQLNFLYPPDSTPPQVLTVRTVQAN